MKLFPVLFSLAILSFTASLLMSLTFAAPPNLTDDTDSRLSAPESLPRPPKSRTRISAQTGIPSVSQPRIIELGKNEEDLRESQEAYFNYQRRTKALSNAIVHLYAASVFLTEASESDKAGILFSQAKDLGRYAQREYRVQLPLELRQNLGLLSEEEYRIQKEREGLQAEMEQLRSQMESVERRLNQLNQR